MTIPDDRLRARLVLLRQEIKAERQEHVRRAVEFKDHGDNERAQYHTGLADGRNSVLAELKAITTEYPPKRMPSEVTL